MPLPFAESFPYASTWGRELRDVLDTPMMRTLEERLRQARQRAVIFPAEQDVFQAFWLTPLEQVRVVIVGQDPYHGQGQAHGLSFSVRPPTKPPPSLRNILKELAADLGAPPRVDGDLTSWARQGVLLLNTILTVEQAQPLSHASYGWQAFTTAVIRRLAARPQPIVFVLWGRDAWQVETLLDGTAHVVLKAPHPSPLSAHRGFFGSHPFSQINRYLSEFGVSPIDWLIVERDAIASHPPRCR